jgi:hypothetical protein
MVASQRYMAYRRNAVTAQSGVQPTNMVASCQNMAEIHPNLRKIFNSTNP